MSVTIPIHIEILVEERSTEVALKNLLPKILLCDVSFTIHSFQGKTDLLKKLPQRLKGYRSWIPEGWKIVVLCDRDNENCEVLKDKLEEYAIQSGFITKSSAGGARFSVLNRIAIEELEAWFLGDAAAIQKAYPKVSANFITQKRYRIPDEIKGGTWEALEALLQDKGYYSSGLSKMEAARAISEHMQPQANCSSSFRCFCAGLQALVQQN